MINKESFSRAELEDAASRLGASGAVAAVLAHLGGEFPALALMDAARAAGRKTRMEEVLAEARMERVLAEARRLRQPSIANDDDVITAGELRGYINRKWGYRGAALEAELDLAMKDIVSHREPEYPKGTVVKDAKDDWWLRTAFGKWESFGVSGSVGHDVPARPLKVMS